MIKANIFSEEMLREEIVKLALLQEGKKYVHGDPGPDVFDCASLANYVYKEIMGIDLFVDGIGESTTTRIMTNPYGILSCYEESDHNKNIDGISRGDILLFHRQSLQEFEPSKKNKYPGHCGIYLGDNNFIHCTTWKKKNRVIISNIINDYYWYKKLVASKDIISYKRVLKKQTF